MRENLAQKTFIQKAAQKMLVKLTTGWGGVALIVMFTINEAYIGSRLGLCWVILEERYEEFRY